jgi:hypothetical protein
MEAPIDLNFDLQIAGRLGVAALAGLAVGIEREWSGHASGPEARFAGARTFLLLGSLGGLAGWLTAGGLPLLGALILGGAMALAVAAYVMASRPGGPAVDGTTEVAALVVLALGAAAGLGFPLLTSGAVALMVLALVEKTRIHQVISQRHRHRHYVEHGAEAGCGPRPRLRSVPPSDGPGACGPRPRERPRAVARARSAVTLTRR